MPKNLLLIAFLSLTFSLTCPAPTWADDDSVRILVYKTSDDQTAKVVIGSQSYHVPISIEAGLGWDDVKDGYYLPPTWISMMKQGRVAISITCSGTAFQMVRKKS